MFFWLPFAFVASAFSFPFMPWKDGGHALPDLSRMPADTMPRISEPGRLIHDLKNLTTEAVRSDSQWFSKFFCFVILILILVVVFT